MTGLALIFLWPILGALLGIGLYCMGLIIKAVTDMFS